MKPKKYRVIGSPGLPTATGDFQPPLREIGQYRFFWTAWLAAKWYTMRGPLSIVYIQIREPRPELPRARIRDGK